MQAPKVVAKNKKAMKTDRVQVCNGRLITITTTLSFSQRYCELKHQMCCFNCVQDLQDRFSFIVTINISS